MTPIATSALALLALLDAARSSDPAAAISEIRGEVLFSLRAFPAGITRVSNIENLIHAIDALDHGDCAAVARMILDHIGAAVRFAYIASSEPADSTRQTDPAPPSEEMVAAWAVDVGKPQNDVALDVMA